MNKKKNVLIAVALVLSMMLISVGLGYAFFSYTKQGVTENVIETGNIKFHYNEQMGKGRGINITDALPLSDSEGKGLTGTGNYFDFEITSNTTSKVEIPYVVTARVNPTTTLNPSLIKIYVTDQNDNMIEDVRYFDEPSNSTGKVWLEQYSGIDINQYVEKVVYTGTVSENSSNYRKDFRVRIWIDDSVEFDDLNNDKTFTITFNVYATGQEKVATPNYTIVSGDLDTPGSEVCLGNECFYVVGQQDATHVKLLAKYPLKVAGSYVGDSDYNLQYTTYDRNNDGILFSNEAYWYDEDEYKIKDKYTALGADPNGSYYVYDENSLVYPYLQTYAEKLNDQGFNVTARLMSVYEAATYYGCTFYYDNYSCDGDTVDLNVSNSEYWLGSEEEETYIWVYDGSGGLAGTNYNIWWTSGYPLRPLVVLEK